MSERFFLKADWTGWREVTKVQWVSAERNAGFHNTMGQPNEPGTGGFSGRGTSGRIIDSSFDTPERYDFDSEFRQAVWPKEHCYECGEFVGAGTGEHHGRAGAVHFSCCAPQSQAKGEEA